MARDLKATEELLSAPIPDLIQSLGLAVAEANKALRSVGTESSAPDLVFTINQAEIELKVAMSYSGGSTTTVGAGGTIYAFNVNASYSKTYSFTETASSRIKITLAAVPRSREPTESE